MSVIIRLQRLPLSANASAIRQFFFGLKIPEGSVHIVGGDDGDAFIGFATDEDARQAMRLDGQPLHNSRVKLLLSSRVEMEAVIAKARAGDLRRQASSSSSARDQPSPARPTDLQRSPSPKRPPPAVSGFSSFPSSSYKNQYQQQTRERPDISAPDSYYNRPGQSGGGGRLMPQPANLPAFGGGGRPLEVSRPLDISGNRPPHLSDNNGSSSRGSGDSWAQRPAPRNDSWVTTPTFGRHTNSHNNNYDSAMSNRPLEGGQQRGQWPPAPSLNQPMEQQGGYGRPQQSNKEEQRNGETFFNHHRPMEDAGRFFGAGARSSDDSQRNAFTGPPHRGLADTMGSQQNSAYGRQPDMVGLNTLVHYQFIVQ
uniref:RRM domain-containing protein n=1 Tax=Plectus sambesii TaxID=2011161 RepID=A0A914V7P0_9BILA